MSEPISPPSPSSPRAGTSATGGAAPERPPLPLTFTITVTGILANPLVSPASPGILDAFHQPDSRAGLGRFGDDR